MKKYIKSYRLYIDSLLETASEDVSWKKTSEEHIKKIGFFQHERLVHLIVTALIAILTIISAAVSVVSGNLMMSVLTIMFLVLLIPYIMHYFTLENEVQKMYIQYDKMIELKNTAAK